MICDYSDMVLFSIQKMPEPGNVDRKSPRIIHKSNDMLTTWQFQEGENKTCI